jgi:hypothetical protein
MNSATGARAESVTSDTPDVGVVIGDEVGVVSEGAHACKA